MDSTNNIHITSDLGQQCHEIRQLTAEGQYSTALGVIRSLRASDPKNIFVIALEKQIEKLLALLYDPALSDPQQQQEIIESIPNLLQRALEQVKKNEVRPSADEIRHTDERQAALANLKSSYFRLADGYLKNRQYLEALDEIKRVLILEPENERAKQYEQRIEECLRNESSSTTVEEGTGKITPQPGEKQHPKKAVPEPVPLPRAEIRTRPTHEQTQEKSDLPSKNGSFTRILIVSTALLGASLTGLYFIFGPEGENPAPASPVVSSNVTTGGTNQKPPEVKEPERTSTINTPVINVSETQKESTQSSRPESIPVVVEKVVKKEPSPAEPAPRVKKATPRVETASSSRPQEKITEKRAVTDLKDIASNSIVPSPVKEVKPAPLSKIEVVNSAPASPPESRSTLPTTFTERKPEVVRLTKPQFPEAARSTSLEGEVLVKVLIDPQGKPVQAKIVKSTNDVFNEAVIDAVMSSQYSPGVMPSGPVSTWLTIPFTFKRNSNR